MNKTIEVPHIIKYMGSKRNILEFIIGNILEVRTNKNQRVYDVFGGSASVSGALREEMPVTCNDIQSYTSVIAGIYLNNYDWEEYDEKILDKIISKAQKKVDKFKKQYSDLIFEYKDDIGYKGLQAIEKKQQNLLNYSFDNLDHLFVKNYSGTYWSYEQCLWIDALSSIARSGEFKNTFLYNVITGSLMFAMAYCSQSTGHYAQYRDLTPQNLDDIILYRRKEILPLFKQKFEALREYYNGDNNTKYNHEITTLNYLEILERSKAGSIIYADPPYQFVHYSRFYHALETLIRYDYPMVQFKGRYRADRYQSPFCIITRVKRAFDSMFKIINKKRSTLVLSYSDTGMITLEELMLLANNRFSNYSISIKEMEYLHSTMGRQGDKNREVKEILLICKPN